MRGVLVATAAVLLAAVPAAHAQRVQADILIGGGPVAGRVVIGAPAPVVVVDHRPRVVVVERWRGPRGRAHGYWRRHGFRPVVLLTDGRGFYQPLRGWAGRPGWREVEVWYGDGHYWVADDWRGDRDWRRDREWRRDWDDRDDRDWRDRRRDRDWDREWDDDR